MYGSTAQKINSVHVVYIFIFSTCSKSDHRPGNDEDVPRDPSWDGTTVTVEEAEDHIDDQGHEQRLSSGTFVSPETKQRRSHQLPKTVGSHHPSQEGGVGMCVVNLQPIDSISTTLM